MSKTIEQLSVAELEKMLNEKRAEETKALAKKRKDYENSREALIEDLGSFATLLEQQMIDLKYSAFIKLTKFREEMLTYGDLRRGEKNKGSFEIKNKQYKIIFTSQINKRFDERAELAEAKLREFLNSTVKKRDLKLHKLITSLLERNTKTQDYDIDLINRLYAMEDTFDDPNWKEALRLFKESYSPTGTAQYVRFFSKVESNNSWKAITLDFAKLNSSKVVIKEAEPE